MVLLIFEKAKKPIFRTLLLSYLSLQLIYLLGKTFNLPLIPLGIK
jgi:hypothetical protein